MCTTRNCFASQGACQTPCQVASPLCRLHAMARWTHMAYNVNRVGPTLGDHGQKQSRLAKATRRQTATGSAGTSNCYRKGSAVYSSQSMNAGAGYGNCPRDVYVRADNAAREEGKQSSWTHEHEHEHPREQNTGPAWLLAVPSAPDSIKGKKKKKSGRG
jgi:hypothetical protein